MISIVKILMERGYIEEFCKIALEKTGDSIKFNNAIKDFLEHVDDEEIKEQMDCLLNDIKRKLKRDIHDNRLTVFEELETYLDTEMQIVDIDPERRENLKENLIGFLMEYISSKDAGFRNDLIIVRKMNKGLNNINKKLDMVVDMVVDMVLINQENKEGSPIRMFASSLCINSPEKLIDREQEQADIQRSFDNGSNVIFLSGRLGMGKSTLARQYANSCGCEKIYFEKYNQSMEYTISKLGREGRGEADEILSYWENLEPEKRRSILLIIDNFNNDTLQNGNEQHYTTEVHSQFFKRLKDVGIHILITTRINMQSETSIGVGPVKETMELFEKYLGEKLPEDQLEKVKELIEIVKGNTMLIAQLANVWKKSDTDQRDQLTEQFRNYQLKENDIKLENETLYEQVKSLLDFTGICSDGEVKKIFASVALMPSKGESRDRFIKMSGCDINKLNDLIDGSWVLMDSDKKVSLHPVVKEIAIQENLVIFENCEQVCEYINDALDLKLPMADRFPYADCAWEIYKIFGSKGCFEEGSANCLNKVLIRIFYRLSDIYDNLGEHERSMEIIDTIDTVDKSMLENDLDAAEKAQILSGIAYSINNAFKSMDELNRASDLLQNAWEILKKIPEDRKGDLDVKQIKAKIMSNIGSNNLAKYKCSQVVERNTHLQNALEWHKKALDFRKNLLDDEEDAKAANSLKLKVAVSYTTVATDYFFMGNYEKAIQAHTKACKIRQELNEENAVSINQQRIIGCLLEDYRRNLVIKDNHWRQILDFYPTLLEINYEYQNKSALEINISYFKDIYGIIQNDRRLEKYLDEVVEKKRQIAEWAERTGDLKDIF